MQPLIPNVHVLDVTSLAGSDMDDDAVGELRGQLRRLASCRMGTRLLRVAVDHRLVVRYATDSDLHCAGVGKAAGQYSTNGRIILLDRAQRPDDLLATLAHELQHFVDDMFGWPVGTIQSEVRANQTEALAIQQLGLDVQIRALMPGGGLRHPEDIAAGLRKSRWYSRYPEEPARSDGRLHPLLTNTEVLPSTMVNRYSATGGSTARVGAISTPGAIGAVMQPQPTGQQPAGRPGKPGPLGAGHPTGWDPSPAPDVLAADRLRGSLVAALAARAARE